MTREEKIAKFLEIAAQQVERMVKEGVSAESITEYQKAISQQVVTIK